MGFRTGICIGVVVLSSFSVCNTLAEAPKLDMNDVSWLWPVPNSTTELVAVISMDGLNSDDGTPVWSNDQFGDLVRIGKSDATRVGSNQIDFNLEFESKSTWKIAAMRIDPTAPGADPKVREQFGSEPQIRLIVQPVTTSGSQVKVHDVAVHLVYSYLLGRDGSGRRIPDCDKFAEIVADLDKLKQIHEQAGVSTAGEPLGVHPGLKANVAGLRDEVRQFLSRHLSASKLTAMALMGLDGPEPWIFVATGKIPPATRFEAIPFLPAQMISFRSPGGFVAPDPAVTNRLPINPAPAGLVPEAQRRGISTAPLFGSSGIDLDAKAVIGTQDGSEVRDSVVRNRDIADVIANPTISHFFNTDCVSCHTETRRRIRLGLSQGDFAFRSDGKPPGIAEDALPDDDWNVRNFGWFTPSIFIGGGPTVPTVSQRTANETAEVVRFIERNYRQDSGCQD